MFYERQLYKDEDDHVLGLTVSRGKTGVILMGLGMGTGGLAVQVPVRTKYGMWTGTELLLCLLLLLLLWVLYKFGEVHVGVRA